jgi:hypothetical protein
LLLLPLLLLPLLLLLLLPLLLMLLPLLLLPLLMLLPLLPLQLTLPHTFPHPLPHTFPHPLPHTFPHPLPHTFPHPVPVLPSLHLPLLLVFLIHRSVVRTCLCLSPFLLPYFSGFSGAWRWPKVIVPLEKRTLHTKRSTKKSAQETM